MKEITGQLVDIHQQVIYPAAIQLENGLISSIRRLDEAPDQYIMPGFVDAHVHIESSMLIPTEFARLAVRHGTVATVSDPHEIANVLGKEGVDYMIGNAKQTPLKIYFGAPSCVPATPFETSGAALGPEEIEQLLNKDEIYYLSEMMNYPGVINADDEVIKKLDLAQKLDVPIDGHAPGLRGKGLDAYLAAGIQTDHESYAYEEGLEKLQKGMKLAIREGSAAKNFEALWPLLKEYPDRMFFCSDDKHPDDLMKGHINQLVARAVKQGIDLFDALHAATVNPVRHYGLDVGLLREGDAADFIILHDPEEFSVHETWINGERVAEDGRDALPSVPAEEPNIMKAQRTEARDFYLNFEGNEVRCIQALDGEIVTKSVIKTLPESQDSTQTDPANDLLKITVLNRYEVSTPSIGFIEGFGMKRGAIASTVAHDSHNIVAVGCSEMEI